MKSPFGQSRIGSNITPTVKLKDGENLFRILPAMGELAADGRWSFYHAVHFGYKNSAGKLRPFNSTYKQNYKTKMVEVPDAALERINTLTAMLEQAKASGDVAKAEKLNALVGRGPNTKAQFNIDKKHYMNALDAQGNVVILSISHKAKQALEAEVSKQRAKGLDPLAAENGCYLSFSRSGMGRDTLVTVAVARDAQDNKIMHSIDDALLSRLMSYNQATGKWTYKEARNLSTLYPFPTPEEIQRIVTEGAPAVDEILDGGNPQAAQLDAPIVEDEVAAPAPAVAPQAPSAPLATAHAALSAAKASAAPAVTTTVPAAPFAAKAAAPTTTEQVTAQSDKDFLASLGV